MPLLILMIVLFSGAAFSAQNSQEKAPPKPLKIAPEDLEEYMQLARTRLSKVPDPAELEALARTSFERIYLHQMRSNFHSRPSPRRAMEKIEGIFRAFDAAQQILRTLRGTRAPAVSQREMNQIMDRLDHAARNIQSDFQEYFTELNRGALSIQIPQLNNDAQDWKFYLVRVDQCFSMLNEQLNQYFFSMAPGTVQVQDYKNPGIITVTKAIRQLTRIYRGRLKVLR